MTAIHVGRIQPLGPAGDLSAFVKSAVTGRVQITSLGLNGDEQGDLRVHGGRDKAVYGYSVENYVAWRADLPEHARCSWPEVLAQIYLSKDLTSTIFASAIIT